MSELYIFQMVVFGKRIEGLLAISVQHRKKMLPSPGFEPATLGFPSRDSTTELQRHIQVKKEILKFCRKDKSASGPVLQSCPLFCEK